LVYPKIVNFKYPVVDPDFSEKIILIEFGTSFKDDTILSQVSPKTGISYIPSYKDSLRRRKTMVYKERSFKSYMIKNRGSFRENMPYKSLTKQTL